MQLTLAQAARLTGTSKATLSRAIKAGRLSATRRNDGYGSYSIDPSELARVYDVTPATGGARLSGWDQLTRREKEIVSLIASGKQNKHIASDLGVKTGTIKVHVNNILKKIEVRNRTALAVLYLSL